MHHQRNHLMPMRGDRLAALREAKGLSQEEVANHIMCNRKQISRWEHNQQDPSGDMLARLAKEFDVSVDYLLDLTSNPRHYLTEADLTPDEGKLLAARRRGDVKAALGMLADQMAEKIKTKIVIPRRKPKVK